MAVGVRGNGELAPVLGDSLIICGPSGAGKGTVISRLIERFPDNYALCVSHTSRSPRPNEVDGVHYHFVTREAMLQDIEEQQRG